MALSSVAYMSIIVTNEITIPAERADVVAKKFEENSKSLIGQDGFIGFELCRPTEPDDSRWLVVTHWRDREAYNSWRDSKHYSSSHNTKKVNQKEPKNSVVRFYDVAFETPRS
ncbi:MAG: antibiotic biosynthesis monooxygenase family protein [Actinomycetaceae bacterium]|nr:antibiotic biosynthesis monooxygenase family protein [Actinomycetaceae bacterium]